MSRTFTDDDLMVWEAFPSGGRFGMAGGPKIIFHCVSNPDSRPRYVQGTGDEADAESLVNEAPDDKLRTMLRESRELE